MQTYQSSRMKTNKIIIIVLAITFIGWGYDGHVIINQCTVISFPPEMSQFTEWEDYIVLHCMYADRRKSNDPNEGPRHYIDIDNYSEFQQQCGCISQNFDSLVAIHGYSFVATQGVLPWAIIETLDSLESSFEHHDFEKAKYYATDLAHYAGDAHMPLHLTRNYDGQYSGQHGVHSRFESTMIGKYSNDIIYDIFDVEYVEDVSNFVFSFIYENTLG